MQQRRNHRLVLALASLIVAAVAWSAAPASEQDNPLRGAVDAAPAQPGPTIAAMIDDFESPDWPPPGTWTEVEDDDPIEYTWGRRDCRVAGGSYSLWCVGGGPKGKRLDCGASYPADVKARIVLNLDLTAYAEAGVLNLAYDMWADTISDSSLGDFISVNLWREGSEPGVIDRVPIYDWTGATGPRFQTQRFNLRDLPDRYNPNRRFDLAGESDVQFEFVFRAMRDSNRRPEGVHLDNFRLEHDGEPTVTPTSAATATFTPEPTPAASLTPTPGDGASTVAIPVAYRGTGLH